MIEQTDAGRFLCLPDGTRLRFPQGMWEYRHAEDTIEQTALALLGWKQVGPALFKWTYQES